MQSLVRSLHINGRDVPVNADGSRTLLSVLRDDLDLTGAKYGCGEGQCGACTVLVDGVAVRSCIVPVRTLGGRKIVTIEGLETSGKLRPLQQAFLEKEAFQCGFCTPGMILTAEALLKTSPQPTETEIKRSMNGNICRCGTYPRIVAAVRLASQSIRDPRRAD
jgi:aerobic-type carbon monoxide dehydrogenase small subunit (CoxS/CutS family)